MKLTLMLLAAALSVSAEPLDSGERNRAMSHLHATSKGFLDTIAGLSETQWNFKPDEKTWSIAECAEHIAVSEDAILGLAQKTLASPAAPEKKTAAKAKDEIVIKGVPDRTTKFQAPEFLRPARRWPDQKALVAHVKKSRAATIDYVKSTEQDLRAHFAPHPVLQDLDAYQWILLLSAHSERHTLQIKEVLAHPNFPK